jgi:predicted kinase
MLVQLVRHNGLPLCFFEKPDPEKAVVGASWQIRLDWVAMLTEADVRGRICPDQAELLDRIDDLLYDDTDFEIIRISQSFLWIAFGSRIPPTANQREVVRLAKDEAKYRLRRKQPFIWNATNLCRHLRVPLVDLFASYSAHVSIVYIVYIDASLALLLSRNRDRKQAVPAATICKLMQRLEVSAAEEAHQVRWIESKQA